MGAEYDFIKTLKGFLKDINLKCLNPKNLNLKDLRILEALPEKFFKNSRNLSEKYKNYFSNFLEDSQKKISLKVSQFLYNPCPIIAYE